MQCWGKGYYGQTGLESWHSIGQIPDQMGDNLAAIDLGIASGQASAATGNNRLLRGLQSSSSAAAAASSSVPVVTAGGQRSCAILDAGSVKVCGLHRVTRIFVLFDAILLVMFFFSLLACRCFAFVLTFIYLGRVDPISTAVICFCFSLLVLYCTGIALCSYQIPPCSPRLPRAGD